MAQVSVVIPTANRDLLLKRAIESVLAQSFQDFEIIVVNDGASDDTKRTIELFADQRISYYKNETRKGGAGTRNVGIHAAKAPLIAFLDDDDRWEKNKLELQMAALTHAENDVVFCFSSVKNIFDSTSHITSVKEGTHNYLEIALSKFNGFLTSTLLVKKTALLDVGSFDESFPSHQEPDLIIRLSKKYRGIGINQPLVEMNVTTGHEHIGSKLERRILGRTMLLKKHFDLFSKNPKVLAKHYFRIGLWNRDLGQMIEAESYFTKAWRTSFSLLYFSHFFAISFLRVPYVYSLKRKKAKQ
jgi:glycosyltransferase involved in cell wall biosynthesis